MREILVELKKRQWSSARFFFFVAHILKRFFGFQPRPTFSQQLGRWQDAYLAAPWRQGVSLAVHIELPLPVT